MKSHEKTERSKESDSDLVVGFYDYFPVFFLFHLELNLKLHRELKRSNLYCSLKIFLGKLPYKIEGVLFFCVWPWWLLEDYVVSQTTRLSFDLLFSGVILCFSSCCSLSSMLWVLEELLLLTIFRHFSRSPNPDPFVIFQLIFQSEVSNRFDNSIHWKWYWIKWDFFGSFLTLCDKPNWRLVEKYFLFKVG